MTTATSSVQKTIHQALAALHVPIGLFNRRNLVTKDGIALTSAEKFEILEVVNRFDWAYCAGNAEALADLLTEDITFDHAMVQAKGIAEVVTIGDRIPVLRTGLRHGFSNHVVFLHDDGNAGCVSFMTVCDVATDIASSMPSKPFVFDCAIVTDTLRKEGGVWKISRRVTDQQKLSDAAADLPDALRLGAALTSQARRQLEANG